jgi:hypothetical protein
MTNFNLFILNEIRRITALLANLLA